MAVTSVREMGARWASGVQGKTEKYASGFARGRDNVAAGLRRIGVTPGPEYTRALTRTSPGDAAARWAAGVNGKEGKYVENWIAAVQR